MMNNQSEPAYLFEKNPDRKACLPSALIMVHSKNIVDVLPDNQGPILPKGLAR
jgi:hypothetical protein